MNQERYNKLIEQEAAHWGSVFGGQPDPENPQLWHDDRLFEIFFGKEFRHFLDRIATTGPDVLELGCGEGSLSIQLAERGKNVTASDLSPERIARARELARNLSNPPTFMVGDLNTISLPSEQYDCVVAHDALHHVLALENLLDEVHKSLRPSGKLIIMDFIGIGRARKSLAALLYALLPTYKPYRQKWKLRKRFASFLASEEEKRRALQEETGASLLHSGSPFEEISQQSILTSVKSRFVIIDEYTFNPFWYYLAPKLLLPKRMRYDVARLLRTVDDLIINFGLSMGAYVFLEAKKL